MKKNFMTTDEYDFLNRIRERKGASSFASFSYSELFGEKPEFNELRRIRYTIMSGKKRGFWTYTVERFGRTEVTYHFKPLIKIIKED